MKNYKTKLNYNKSAKLFIKNQKAETIKSLLHENRFNNNKNKNRISSLISILNSKKIKKHKIILEKIHSRSVIDKKYKNINSKKNVNNISSVCKKENNLKTELSTSANSKSKFLYLYPP